MMREKNLVPGKIPKYSSKGWCTIIYWPGQSAWRRVWACPRTASCHWLWPPPDPPVGILILCRTLRCCCSLLTGRCFRRLIAITIFLLKSFKIQYKIPVHRVHNINIEQYRVKIDFRYLKQLNRLNIKLLKISRKHMVVLSRIGELVEYATSVQKFKYQSVLDSELIEQFTNWFIFIKL